MSATVTNFNEYRYEKFSSEKVDLHQDNTYRKQTKTQWTEESYAKAYMKLLTQQVNK
ncbi:hypothetical protein AB1283_00740 [Bacillus sp. S13(2024)]|uniref:hypothetical protein n=1 Tax=Bacillus sp. S13(2024) TaxID=3162885 RepID=UPI003D194834